LAGCFLALSLSGFKQAASPQADAFNQDRAWNDLIVQCGFGPRKPGTAEHIKCRDYISDELKKSCLNVHFQEFTHRWSVSNQDLTMWNIVGEQNWKDATVRVLLVAHWDSRPTAELESDPEDKKKAVPGANDGASGVAVLLELARVLKGHLPAGVGVEYLMTDGQALGPKLDEMFLGAEAFAKDLPNHTKPNYGIVVDMVGKKNLNVSMELNSIKSAKTLVYALCRHATQIGLGEVFPMEFGQELSDDHVPLNRAGLKTIDLIDFHYLQYWHTLQDTPDKCSPDSLGQVGKLLQTWLQKDPPFDYG